MNGDMFNALSAMKQSEKPSEWHKIRGKGFKQCRKLSWYVKFRGALAAIRLLAVCVPHARRGL